MDDRLPPNERRILASFLLFIVAWPAFSTFVNTFLWRASGDPVHLAAYAIGMYVGVPLGFYLNSALLLRVPFKWLFLAACVLQGIVPLVLTIVRPDTVAEVTAFGALFGIPMGLYWGNRNLMTLCATEQCHRLRFLSVEAVQNTAAGIVVPLLIGYWLANAGNVGTAYVALMVVGLILLTVSGLLIGSADTEIPHRKEPSAFVRGASRLWNTQRAFEFLIGAMTASESTMSMLVILTFLGLEDAVGTVRSLAAVLTALVMYRFGRRIPESRYRGVLWFSFALIGASAVAFAVGFSPASAIPYFVAAGLVGAFRSTTTMNAMYKTVDHEAGRTDRNRFAYLFDREVALNAGRVTALVAMIAVLAAAPESFLRYGLVVAALMHLPLAWLLRRIQTGQAGNEKPSQAGTGG